MTRLFAVNAPLGDSNDCDYQILRRSTMALAILSHFLFQTTSDILIPIICGFRVMRNVLMLVLVKTLMGLHRGHVDGFMLTSRALFIL